MNYKHILPIEINYKLKNSIKFLQQKKPEYTVDNKNKYVYFLDIPSYGNVGDQAIALSMEKYMNDYFYDYKQIEFLESNVVNYINWLKKNIKKEDIICLTGGGNMGTMYQKYEAIRRLIIKKFPNNKIIIFPQTISYDNSNYSKREFKKSAKIYNNHKDICLMAREEKSYEIMKEKYNKCNVILCPDIVLYLDYRHYFKKSKENTLGLCLRDDKEKINVNHLKEFISKLNMKKITISNIYDFNIVDSSTRKKVVENKLKEFASNNLIITDRLHGMIFSYITNTPCIALPNSNGKVEGVYKWIKNKGKVEFMKSINEDYVMIDKDNEILKKEYDEMHERIEEFLNVSD